MDKIANILGSIMIFILGFFWWLLLPRSMLGVILGCILIPQSGPDNWLVAWVFFIIMTVGGLITDINTLFNSERNS